MADQEHKKSTNIECKAVAKQGLVLIFHIILVLATFAIGAVCFMFIEHPEMSEDEKSVVMIDQDVFLDSIQTKYKLNLTGIGKNITSDFKKYFDEVEKYEEKKEHIEAVEDRWGTFGKWFYFTTIVGTTIGKIFLNSWICRH